LDVEQRRPQGPEGRGGKAEFYYLKVGELVATGRGDRSEPDTDASLVTDWSG